MAREAASTCDHKIWEVCLDTVELHSHHLAICDGATPAGLQQLLVLQTHALLRQSVVALECIRARFSLHLGCPKPGNGVFWDMDDSAYAKQ